MKAIVQDRYGSPDVLELREIDRPVNVPCTRSRPSRHQVSPKPVPNIRRSSSQPMRTSRHWIEACACRKFSFAARNPA